MTEYVTVWRGSMGSLRPVTEARLVPGPTDRIARMVAALGIDQTSLASAEGQHGGGGARHGGSVRPVPAAPHQRRHYRQGSYIRRADA